MSKVLGTDEIHDLKRGDPITVYWIDADTEMEIWHDADYEIDHSPVKTRGYFISQTPEVIALCSSVANLPLDEWPDQDCFGGIWKIPTKFIISLDIETRTVEEPDQ